MHGHSATLAELFVKLFHCDNRMFGIWITAIHYLVRSRFLVLNKVQYKCENTYNSDVQIVGILHTKLIYITVFLPNKSRNSKNILYIYEKCILLKRDLNYFKKYMVYF